MTKNNLPSFSLLLSLEKDTRGEVGINRVCSDTRGREEKSTLPIRNNPLKNRSVDKKNLAKEVQTTPLKINSNTLFLALFIVQCTIINFRLQDCLPIIFVCLFFERKPCQPCDWMCLVVCLLVCLLVCWKGKAGRKYGGKKKTHPVISNQLARYYFFPFWFRL